MFCQVAFHAFRDWLMSRRIERRMHELLKGHAAHQSRSSSTSSDTDIEETAAKTTCDIPFAWTRVHSHFALMGGFVFDSNDMPVDMDPLQAQQDSHHATRLTVTPVGLCKLAEYEPALLCELPEKAIQDQSKANGFAKTLVCFQATWFLVQTIGRISTNHPISLLELSTAIHALCCLAIYFAWWRKPLDIEQPFTLNMAGESAKRIRASMIMNSEMSKIRRYHGPTIRRKRGGSLAGGSHIPDPEYIVEDPYGELHLSYAENNGGVDIEPDRLDEILEKLRLQDWAHRYVLHQNEMLFGFHLTLHDLNDRVIQWPGVYTTLSIREAYHLRLAQAFRREHPGDGDWSGKQIATSIQPLNHCNSHLSRPTY
jgi:hypothetical protein